MVSINLATPEQYKEKQEGRKSYWQLYRYSCYHGVCLRWYSVTSFHLVVNFCSQKVFSLPFCHLAVILGDQDFHNQNEGCSACTGKVWGPWWLWKLWGSIGRKVRWFWGEGGAGTVSLAVTVHPLLSEVGQWTRQNCISTTSAPAFHTYLHEIENQASACAVQMAKNDILFDIKEHIYSERSGNQTTKEKIFGSSGGVIYLTKEGSISLLTYKLNGKLCFLGADLELLPRIASSGTVCWLVIRKVC